jgi:hypothetical protein
VNISRIYNWDVRRKRSFKSGTEEEDGDKKWDMNGNPTQS